MTTPTDLSDFVNLWTLQGHSPIGSSPDSDESFEDLLDQISFMAHHAYEKYVPALFSKHPPVFKDRLVKWMQNEGVDETDQMALFQFVLRLAYFSFDDFISMYGSAYNGPISRWIWQQANLTLDTPHFNLELEKEQQRHTWYVSITDSMLISEFYHCNSLAGTKYRPSLFSLKDFADLVKIRAHIKDNEIKRIVLLEDFVGSGAQAFEIVQWVVREFGIPVLFCPMVICPDGNARLRKLEETTRGVLTLSPVMLLGDSVFASRSGGPEDAIMAHIKGLVSKIHPKVAGSTPAGTPPYSEHGYHLPGDKVTGATVVMFSNTPDNSLPILHFNSKHSDWVPLFPRVSRETA